MSTRKGEATRKRPQKYQNTKAFKNDLHDKTVQTKQLNSLHISNVCQRCKSVLEWKIKYKKFKPLKAPGTCTKCLQKCVKHAYHIMCKPCADKAGVCPKCGECDELVEPVPTVEEQMKLDQEMQAMLKSLPERKRRTFLRFVEKNSPGKKKKKKQKDQNEGDGSSNQDNTVGAEEAEHTDNVQKGTKDLMAFLEKLKLSTKNGDEFDDFDSDDFGDDDDDDDDDDDEEEDEDEDNDSSENGK